MKTALCTIVLMMFCTLAWGEEIVYVGYPLVKVSGEPGNLKEEVVSPGQAKEYECKIVRRGSKYYWASRKNEELHLERSGRYLLFSSPIGIVKIVDPVFDEVRQPLRAS